MCRLCFFQQGTNKSLWCTIELSMDWMLLPSFYATSSSVSKILKPLTRLNQPHGFCLDAGSKSLFNDVIYRCACVVNIIWGSMSLYYFQLPQVNSWPAEFSSESGTCWMHEPAVISNRPWNPYSAESIFLNFCSIIDEDLKKPVNETPSSRKFTALLKHHYGS